MRFGIRDLTNRVHLCNRNGRMKKRSFRNPYFQYNVLILKNNCWMINFILENASYSMSIPDMEEYYIENTNKIVGILSAMVEQNV